MEKNKKNRLTYECSYFSGSRQEMSVVSGFSSRKTTDHSTATDGRRNPTTTVTEDGAYTGCPET